MNEDKLKSFVQSNKDAFDSAKAPDRVWDRIEKDMGHSPKSGFISYKSMFLILGLVLVLFTAGIIIGSKYFGTQNQELMYASIEDPEFRELDQFYKNRLQEQRIQFVNQVNEKSVLDDLKDLDNGFMELKKDFVHSDADNKELIMSLMKENYELRIKIIELAMEKIKTDSVSVQKNKYYEY